MWVDKNQRDTYYPIAYDLFSRNILDKDDMYSIRSIKIKSSKMDKNKERDDYEIQ